MFLSANYRLDTQILTFTLDMAERCSHIMSDETIDMELMSQMEIIFKSQPCLNGSFLATTTEIRSCSKKCSNVNIREAERAFDHVMQIEHDSLKAIVRAQLSQHNNLI